MKIEELCGVNVRHLPRSLEERELNQQRIQDNLSSRSSSASSDDEK
jgi:hypothetical protein